MQFNMVAPEDLGGPWISGRVFSNGLQEDLGLYDGGLWMFVPREAELGRGSRLSS